MILLPAIDVRGGRAVRLVQGDYARETAFDDDPLAAARRWVEQGARMLHVVDLDGARAGEPGNLPAIARLASGAGVPVQLGGGLRSVEAVEAAFEAGVERVVLGTAAVEDPALVESLVAEHDERIVVALDARGGRVAVEGWERSTATAVGDAVADLARRGVRRFVFTPVEVDGTLEGPGLAALRDVAKAAQEHARALIYSGGVGSLEHLRELARLALPPVEAVIVGRALYEGRFTVAQGQAALDEPAPPEG